MKYLYKTIVFKEVPNEVSLCYSFTGCPLRCKGCHSPELRNSKLGVTLTLDQLDAELKKHEGFITCVLFFGGDWNEKELVNLLTWINYRHPKLKVCLYSGYSKVSTDVLNLLTYVKVGAYEESLGGLESPTTNQRFYDLSSKDDICKMKDLTSTFYDKTHNNKKQQFDNTQGAYIQ